MEYYVYRFLDGDRDVVYVGRTTNLRQRFNQHEHLSKDVKEIQYIKCASEADMLWKELYYINYYHNSKTTNTSGLANDDVTESSLNDKWTKYKGITEDEDQQITTLEEYNKIINLPINKSLIDVYIPKRKMLSEDDLYQYSKKWIVDNMDFTKKKIYNYFNNIHRDLSKNISWMTYPSLFESLKGGRYVKGFNKPDRTNLAYIRNDFYAPGDKHELTDDQYALANLLQFIWRSAIRSGEPITIYIPSRRMRELLIGWIGA